jgi:hypothetical protein
MKSLTPLSIVLWIAMWIAFYLDSPLGFIIPVLGLAAAIAIATEVPAQRAAKRRSRTAVGAKHQSAGPALRREAVAMK